MVVGICTKYFKFDMGRNLWAFLRGCSSGLICHNVSFNLTIIQTAMIIILSSVAQIPVCAISLLIDIIRPKLTWSNPQEAIKQNMNGVLGMLIGIAFLLAIGVILFFIVMTGLNVYTIFGIALVLLASLSYTSLRILYAYAEKGFRKIEA